MNLDLGKYTLFSCWTSIVLILWGMITKVIQPTWISWFSLGFFCVAAVLVYSMTRK